MTGYLLHWQWKILKRQFMSPPMAIHLGVTLLFQIGLMVALLADPTSYTDSVSMFVLYTFMLSLGQTMNAFSQGLLVASMGLLGIAPIPHRPRMAMALFNLLISAAINAGLLAVGLGISLLLHGCVGGALLVMVLTLITTVCAVAGVGASLTAFVIRLLPKRLKNQAGVVITPFLFIMIAVVSGLQDHHPHALDAIGNLFLAVAAHPSHAAPEVSLFLGVAGVGVVLAAIPFAQGFTEVSQRPADGTTGDSRTHKKTAVPAGRGWLRLLLWHEWLVFRRSRGLTLGFTLLFLLVFCLFPSTLSGVAFLFLGVQMGAMVYSKFGNRAMLLIYLVPIRLDQFWLRRMVILLVQALALSALFITGEALIQQQITWMTALNDLMMTALGVCVMSFFVFFMTQRAVTAVQTQKGRFTAKALLVSLLMNAFPFGIAILNHALPPVGLVVDIGILLGFLLFGPTYLRMNKSLQYPMGS